MDDNLRIHKPDGRKQKKKAAVGRWLLLLLVFCVAGGIPFPDVALSGTFTIVSIKPDTRRQGVLVRFDAPVSLKALRKELRIFPYAYVDWQRSEQLRPDAVFLKGEFQFGRRYVLSLPQGFTACGLDYRKTIHAFRMPDRPPEIVFVGNKSVIERDSRQMIHFRTVNVDRVVVRTASVPLLFLPAVLDLGRRADGIPWPRVLEEIQRLRQRSKRMSQNLGALEIFFRGKIVQGKQIFSVGGEKNRERSFSLPLTFRKNKDLGSLELVRLESPDQPGRGPSATRLFRVTDLGITGKVGSGKILIWVTSLRSGKPRSGVSLAVFTEKGEVFFVGKTDDQGILLIRSGPRDGFVLDRDSGLRRVSRRVEIQEIRYVAAADDSDVSYLEIDPEEFLKPDDTPWAFGSWKDHPILSGTIFTERGVYRPGDTVHFKGFAREFSRGGVRVPEHRRGSIRVSNSRGDVVFERDFVLSDYGTCWGVFPIEPFAPLGVYTLEMVLPADADADQGNTFQWTFQVQEFRKPRHFVRIHWKEENRPNKEYVHWTTPERIVRFTFSAEYYSGGPVKHGRIRWSVYHNDPSYLVPNYESYRFGFPSGDEPALVESGESVLDEHGRLSVEFPLDRDVLAGKRGLLVSASVIDFDGRVATETLSVAVEPEILIGIAPHPEKLQADTPFDLRGVVVTSDGKLVREGTVQAAVMKRTGTYVQKRTPEGHLDWQYRRIWRKIYGVDLPIEAGRIRFPCTLNIGGQYLIRFRYRDETGRDYVSAAAVEIVGDPYWVAYESREKAYLPFGISADKEEYRPGETARIRLASSRRPAAVLFTIEQDDVLLYRVIQERGELNRISLPVREAYAPNAYLAVLGTVPRGAFPLHQSSFDKEAPGFLFGVLRLRVFEETGRLQVRIAPDRAALTEKPGQEVNLDLVVTDPNGKPKACELAVAVVDEGVLALTRYKTPDLEDLLRFDGPLGVGTKEIRSELLRQTPFHILKNAVMTGGGGDEGGVPASDIRKNFNPVAYFNPSVVTGPDGRASVSFTLPDSMTAYRVFVVACDRGRGIGHGERRLRVEKEFFLQAGIPRFFVEGDRFRFPVRVENRTKRTGRVHLTVQTNDRIEIIDPEREITVEAGQSRKCFFRGRALKTGDARILLSGEMAGHRDAVERRLPVASRYTMGTHIQRGGFTESETIDLPLGPEYFPPHVGKVPYDAVSLRLTVSTSPFLPFASAFRYLLEYPYGCVEQTSSGMIALAGVRSLVRNALIPGLKLPEVDKFLKRGMERLFSMQLEDGGFGYWPGYSYSDPHGSLYASAALVLTRQSGMKVPKRPFQAAMKYLREMARRQREPLRDRAFAGYVLAMAGKINRRVLQSLTDEGAYSGNALIEALCLLANERMGTMDRSELMDALQTVSIPEASDEEEIPFNAKHLTEALWLLLGTSAAPGDETTRDLAETLVEAMGDKGFWTSTSDTGWVLLALGRYYAHVLDKAGGADIVLEHAGRTLRSSRIGPSRHAVWSLNPEELAVDPWVTLQSSSGVPVYYLLEAKIPRMDVMAVGRSAGFTVSKKMENMSGTGPIKKGDVVRVIITVESDRDEARYVVLEDALPAGLEAVNSALAAEEPVAGSRGAEEYASRYWNPDGSINFVPNFFEIRDRKVIAYRDRIWRGLYRFSYYARAVCQGEFHIPPLKVELMYEPEVNGYGPEGRLVIGGEASE